MAYDVWRAVPLSIRLPALLLLFSYRHWYYSVHGRGYTLGIGAAMLSFYCFWRGWQDHRRRDWIAYVLATVAVVYTHLFSIMILPAQGAFALLDVAMQRENRSFVQFVRSGLIPISLPLFLYLPILSEIVHEVNTQSFVTATPFVQSPANVVGLLARIGPSPNAEADAVFLIVLAASIIGLAFSRFRQQR